MVVYSREREEIKKERKKSSKAQALACLIVLSFVFALCY
jgi:hypothetical protein